MSKKELRELDAWIASNIFMFYVHHDGSVPYVSQFKRPDWDKKYGLLPEYSTDPAAAMLVLEKCKQIHADNKLCVWVHEGRELDCSASAESFQLAICLFAKQLFSK